ncbi:HARB1 nuclease, partial [Amia calva]|nr:HARB1 nuclease [Amia calva]
FFVNANFLYNIGDAEHVRKTMVRRAIRRVCVALKRFLQILVAFTGHKSPAPIREEFYRITGFPNVIGCIDGTHIPSKAPPGPNEADFVNRKSYIICDSQQLITNVESTLPRTVKCIQIVQPMVIVFCDNIGQFIGYPDPAPGTQMLFNTAHAKTRASVEMTLGIMKSCFHCVRGLRVTPETAFDITIACVVLHNIAVIRREQHPPVATLALDDDPIGHIQDYIDGRAV